MALLLQKQEKLKKMHKHVAKATKYIFNNTSIHQAVTAALLTSEAQFSGCFIFFIADTVTTGR